MFETTVLDTHTINNYSRYIWYFIISADNIIYLYYIIYVCIHIQILLKINTIYNFMY